MSCSRYVIHHSDKILLLTQILQFNVSNTLPDTVLEQVSVIMTPQADCGLTEDFIIPLPSLTAASSPNIVYVSFTRESPHEYTLASFQCLLKFVSKELDPSTGEPEEEGYEDEYQLEEVELSAGGDYIVPSYASFSSEWDRLRGGASSTETFALSAMESIKGEDFSFEESEFDIDISIA
jgi:coatomer subunit gamma